MVGLRSLFAPAKPKPLLSVVVIVHRMPDQAERTLFSLSDTGGHEVATDSGVPDQVLLVKLALAR